ncbi:hypothetical protein [Celeribacter baekdonensis]|uniref:Uncharacterized protein n=1 Tax=Celeribacter baekdonensis TaxID=875171 RepID=A0A2R4M7L2_9RHOB|nr:hypothetical protein [Celeribacter baekdonensis]AVW93128.1 hypothetical protein DA792_20260 [Celeribacter baekdonensis]
MTYQNLILGLSIHLLIYEHLPHWGAWFNRLLKALPLALQTLYEQWRCPYCAGFWIGLALHAVTGQWLFDSFVHLPTWLGVTAQPLGWIMDALAFAVLNKVGILFVNAIGYPALLGYQMKQEFIARKSVAQK